MSPAVIWVLDEPWLSLKHHTWKPDLMNKGTITLAAVALLAEVMLGGNIEKRSRYEFPTGRATDEFRPLGTRKADRMSVSGLLWRDEDLANIPVRFDHLEESKCGQYTGTTLDLSNGFYRDGIWVSPMQLDQQSLIPVDEQIAVYGYAVFRNKFHELGQSPSLEVNAPLAPTITTIEDAPLSTVTSFNRVTHTPVKTRSPVLSMILASIQFVLIVSLIMMIACQKKLRAAWKEFLRLRNG